MKIPLILSLIFSLVLVGCGNPTKNISSQDILLDSYGFPGFTLRIIDPMPEKGLLRVTYPLTIYLFYKGNENDAFLKTFSFSFENSASDYGATNSITPESIRSPDLNLRSGGILTITTAFRFSHSLDALDDIDRLSFAYGLNNFAGISWMKYRLLKHENGEIRITYFLNISKGDSKPARIPIFSVSLHAKDETLVRLPP
jgi:hypothetical protein